MAPLARDGSIVTNFRDESRKKSGIFVKSSNPLESLTETAIAARVKELADGVGNIATLAKIARLRDSTVRSAAKRGGMTLITACKIAVAAGRSLWWLATGCEDSRPETLREESLCYEREVHVTMPVDVKAGETIIIKIVAVEPKKKLDSEREGE